MKLFISFLISFLFVSEITFGQGYFSQQANQNKKGLGIQGVQFTQEIKPNGVVSFKVFRFEINSITLPGETTPISVADLKAYGISNYPLECTDCSFDYNGRVSWLHHDLTFKTTLSYGKKVVANLNLNNIESEIKTETEKMKKRSNDLSEGEDAWTRMAMIRSGEFYNFRGPTIDRLYEAARAYLADKNGTTTNTKSSHPHDTNKASFSSPGSSSSYTGNQSSVMTNRTEQAVENTINVVRTYMNHYEQQKAKKEVLRKKIQSEIAERERIIEERERKYYLIKEKQYDEYLKFLSSINNNLKKFETVSSFSNTIKNSTIGDTIYYYPFAIDFSISKFKTFYDLEGQTFPPKVRLPYVRSNYEDNNLGKGLRYIITSSLHKEIALKMEEYILSEIVGDPLLYESSAYMLASKNKDDLKGIVNSLSSLNFKSFRYRNDAGNQPGNMWIFLKPFLVSKKVSGINKFFYPVTADDFIEAYKKNIQWLKDYDKMGWTEKQRKPLYDFAKDYLLNKAKEINPNHGFFNESE